VLPGDVDDPTAPSGGNGYDRRVCHGLSAAGWSVREWPVHGDWPLPDPATRAELTGVLAGLPDGAPVLLDGLAACGVPEVVVPHADRLRPAVLVHLPLADETGLSGPAAADLHARERATLHAVPAVLATSTGTARRLVERHDLSPDRVHVVPPGVEPAPLAAGTDGASRLLCVAAVTPRKGHDVLVEALATITDLGWECVCVGAVDRDREHVARLRARIAAAGLGDRVRLVGTRTGAALAAEYAAADLLVLPSRAEPYGMVLTEALARGVPVLASAVDGVPEAVGRTGDGVVPGLLVPPADPTALATALRRWLGDEQLRRRLRTAARGRRATLPGWEVTSRNLADVLGRLVTRPN
jgi:glycosyltransferase involved in cell wall biosynthesis